MLKIVQNMKVGARLITTFTIVASISIVVGTIGILNMSKISVMLQDMYGLGVMATSQIKEARVEMAHIGRARSNFLLASSEQERGKQKAFIEKNLAAMQGELAKSRLLFPSDRAKQLFAAIDSEMQIYQAQESEILKLAAAEKFQEHNANLLDKMNAARIMGDHLAGMMNELAAMKEARAKEQAAAANELYTSSRNIMLGLMAGALLLGLAIGILITRGLLKQLGGEPDYAVQVAGAIASGDLSAPIKLGTADHSSLLFAMREMRDSLVGIVSQVRSGTDTIATASAQIAAGNQDLSSRTEQQASSLEETASSMEELTSTVRQNADNARQASQFAQSASATAHKGGAVVAQVVTTMNSINASSNRVVDIIAVIDGIAFQTNILALNAAVEAARAGEQGRGFAVVAAEVRNLAHRSAAAAKEIKALIDASVESVTQGAVLVDQAGATMEEVVGSIMRVTEIVGEITASSQEQATGIEQVNQAITQMDQVTQQNAALVEEAAAAAASMQEQAGALATVVGIFKLDAGSHATANATPMGQSGTIGSRRAAASNRPMRLALQ